MINQHERNFFSGFPAFNADESQTATDEFIHLASIRGWTVNSKTWRQQWLSCFGVQYKSDGNGFFDKFANFIANPTKRVEEEFDRLARLEGWKKGSRRYRREWVRCSMSGFTAHYGTGAEKLVTWQDLCKDVAINPIPPTITQCKKALRRVKVNLLDLINYRNGVSLEPGLAPTRPAVFRSLQDFRAYTQNGRTFPKEAAYVDGFIKILLREIF